MIRDRRGGIAAGNVLNIDLNGHGPKLLNEHIKTGRRNVVGPRKRWSFDSIYIYMK